MTSQHKVLFSFVSAVALGMGALAAQAQKKTPIPYPTGYRHWTLVKSMVIYSKDHPLFNQFEGLHNVYVNDAGLQSLMRGRTYPDGSVIVFDLFDARTARGAIEPHTRKFIAVMKKNAKLYPDTGGWGFEVFRDDEGVGSLQDMKKQCFDCHASQKSKDYVFSDYTP